MHAAISFAHSVTAIAPFPNMHAVPGVTCRNGNLRYHVRRCARFCMQATTLTISFASPRSTMSWSEWKLTLKPTTANKYRTSEPKSFLVSPGLTDRDILETALPVFARGCVTLDLRSCKDFHRVVNLRLMLESVHQNSPSASMDPDQLAPCWSMVASAPGPL